LKFVISVAFSDPVQAMSIAQCAEECGWDAITISDHVVHPKRIDSPYPYSPDGQPRFVAGVDWPDPWVTIAAMAAVTKRIHFTTNVYVLPMRNPFQVAKTVSTAAVVSGGRVALGIGMGWMEEEFRLLEQPFRQRGPRADEMVEVMRKLWTGEMVEHHGRFYDFEPVQMCPKPPPIPIYVGGVSEAALRRVGRLGDGWLSDLHTTAELGEIVGRIRAYRAEFGREKEPLDVVGSAIDAFDVDGYRRLEEAGVTHVATMPWFFYGGMTDDLDKKLEGIRRFADDIIAKMGS
jgi:probable F420-dependent oxidoreductase